MKLPTPRTLKLTSLNESGFDHFVAVSGFIVLFALVGTFLLLKGIAATSNVYLHMGSTNGPCIAGTTIQHCTGSPAQTFGKLSGSNFQIKNGSGQCLDDWGGKMGTNSKNRVYIHVAGCYGNRNQQWNWSGGRLVNVASHGCINALGDSGSAGTALIVFTCNGQSNEIWKETTARSSGGGGNGGGGSSSCASGVRATPGQAQKIAQCELAKYGWSSQYSCLDNIYQRESGWRYDAANASGAYGIPQSLPGSKMATAGSDWQYNATTQIEWGLSYIKAVYKTPCGAWSFWQGHHWYIEVRSPSGVMTQV